MKDDTEMYKEALKLLTLALLLGLTIGLVSKAECADNKVYFELGAGMHDNIRDSYKTASKKLGHVVIGYQYDIFYGEIAHDSDLQAKDVGFDRLYLGIRKEWDL